MSKQMANEDFLSSRPADASPMFTTPVGYTGWRYAVKQVTAGGVALAVAAPTLPTLITSGSIWAYPAVGAVVLGYFGVRQRLEFLREGRPLTGILPFRPKRIEENAGRTFLPEYAQYQKALDKVALEKQAKRPKFLKGRHDKRDSRGRFAP